MLACKSNFHPIAVLQPGPEVCPETAAHKPYNCSSRSSSQFCSVYHWRWARLYCCCSFVPCNDHLKRSTEKMWNVRVRCHFCPSRHVTIFISLRTNCSRQTQQIFGGWTYHHPTQMQLLYSSLTVRLAQACPNKHNRLIYHMQLYMWRLLVKSSHCPFPVQHTYSGWQGAAKVPCDLSVRLGWQQSLHPVVQGNNRSQTRK